MREVENRTHHLLICSLTLYQWRYRARFYTLQTFIYYLQKNTWIVIVDQSVAVIDLHCGSQLIFNGEGKVEATGFSRFSEPSKEQQLFLFKKAVLFYTFLP